MVVVDGNMDQTILNSGQDGEILVDVIHTADPKVKIIGMSSHSIKGVDKNVLKGNERFLGKVVQDL